MKRHCVILLLTLLNGANAVAEDRSVVAPAPPDVIAPRERSQPVQAYRFIHHETTGITSYILVNGKEVAIKFSPDSDQRALELLYGLNWRVLLPNAGTACENCTPRGLKPGGIYLVGQLWDGISRTPDAPMMAMSQPFHEFTLSRWYIAAPVLEHICWPTEFDYVKTIRRKKLKKSDFDSFKDVRVSDEELRALHTPGR